MQPAPSAGLSRLSPGTVLAWTGPRANTPSESILYYMQTDSSRVSQVTAVEVMRKYSATVQVILLACPAPLVVFYSFAATGQLLSIRNVLMCIIWAVLVAPKTVQLAVSYHWCWRATTSKIQTKHNVF